MNFLYKELRGIVELLRQCCFKNSNVLGFGISDKDNAVIVELLEYTDSVIEFFEESILDSDLIQFREGVKSCFQQTVRPGGRTGRTAAESNNNNGSSIAVRAQHPQLGSGFLVSGHSFTMNGNVFVGGTQVGRIGAIRVGGPTDAAFCVTTNHNNTTLSNQLSQNTAITISGVGLNAQNVTVWQAGFRTGVTQGTIAVTGWSEIIEGISFTNLVVASYHSLHGDSGGIIYRNGSNPRHALGIHIATNGRYGTIANANAALGTSLN